MKKYLFILAALFILSETFNYAQEFKLTSSQKVKLEQLKKEVYADLTANILPYWSSKMIDNVNGGFYGRIDGKEQVYPNDDKGGILNARILWTYSSAYRVLKDTSCLRIATRAKDYILSHFVDNQYGGAYRSVNFKGEPSDIRKQTYTNAFFIYGLSEYNRATGDQEALKKAKEIFEVFEKHVLDKEANGYFEAFSREWNRTGDRLIGESSANVQKTMNTSLHVMEAYANLYRVYPDKVVAGRLRNMVEIFLDKIVDKKTFHLICFLDKDWKSTATIDSYGHDIECSWLLYEAAHLLGDPRLIARVKEVSIKIADAAAEGLRPDGGMVSDKDYSTGHVRPGRSWWEQAETVVGYLNAFELTGNEAYLDKAVNCWNYIDRHFIDKKNGGWFSSVTDAGEPGRGDKAGFWICPYHNGRMCLEVIERVSSH